MCSGLQQGTRIIGKDVIKRDYRKLLPGKRLPVNHDNIS